MTLALAEGSFSLRMLNCLLQCGQGRSIVLLEMSDSLCSEEGVEKYQFAVIPAPAYCLRGQAPAGIPKPLRPMDSCLRRNDGEVVILLQSTPSRGEKEFTVLRDSLSP